MYTFTECVKKVESQKISASETYSALNNLLKILELEKGEKFVGFITSGEMTNDKFYEEVDTFYTTVISYLQRWSATMRVVSGFDWTNLRKMPTWDVVEKTMEFVSTRFIKSFNENSIFQENSCLLSYTNDENVNDWNLRDTPTENRWLEVVQHFNQESIRFEAMIQLAEFGLCLPGTNAPVERIFSLINNYWTSEKSNLDISTLKAATFCKANVHLKCIGFCESIKKDQVSSKSTFL